MAILNKNGSTVITLILFTAFFSFHVVQAAPINNKEQEGTFGFHTNGVTGVWVLGMTYPYSEDLTLTANWLAGGEEGTSGIGFGLETSIHWADEDNRYKTSLFYLPPLAAKGFGLEPSGGLVLHSDIPLDERTGIRIKEDFQKMPAEGGSSTIKDIEISLYRKTRHLPGKDVSINKDFPRRDSVSFCVVEETIPGGEKERGIGVKIGTELCREISSSTSAAVTMGFSGWDQGTRTEAILSISPELLWRGERTRLATGADLTRVMSKGGENPGKTELGINLAYSYRIPGTGGEFSVRLTCKNPDNGPPQRPLYLAFQCPWGPELFFRLEAGRTYQSKTRDSYTYLFGFSVGKGKISDFPPDKQVTIFVDSDGPVFWEQRSH